jgi:enterochelin esterase-like enzyme
MRMAWISALAAATVLYSSATADGQGSSQLIAGFYQERSLGPGENDVYMVSLNEGEAVVGEADQHGVDLVIDEFGPDGKLIRTVDSLNGTEGPEPIDLTAITAGQYKLVIHTLDPTAKPGKYVMKIDRLLTVEQNGLRLAEKNYPSVIQNLWKDYAKDPSVLGRFVASRKGNGPAVEPIKDDSKDVNVVYLYYGDEQTESVQVFGGTHSSVGGTQMERFLRTPLFFGSETVPKDSRYSYGFTVTETRLVGPKQTLRVSEDHDTTDPFNPNRFGDLSVLTLPDAPPQPYVIENDSAPRGKVSPTTFKSEFLHENRTLGIYTPPGYDSVKAADLLIVFDGETYDGGRTSLIPTPTILDNLIAAGKIGDTIAVFVDNMGQRNRDLGGYPPFADFVALELIPWVRKNYRVKGDPSHVVLAGSSRGGVAASHCAFLHPDVVGNVLSQSGAYFVRKDDPPPAWPVTQDTGDLILTFRTSPGVPIKFYMEVGRFDSLVAQNRELRDVLLLKGYAVDYREFDGGHDYFYWRGSLADGLVSLIGRNRD